MPMYAAAGSRISGGVCISRKMSSRSATPATVETAPRIMMRINELDTVRRISSSSRAPRYCATMVVVAMVRPIISATMAYMTGKLTDTAPSAEAPT